ncbi:hypothetical protein Y032_0131g1623 [Ancylostoma ceylanicum]|uniref:Uncharacterized protein n=1 Tax=Ancylostoma ceylanicum TaxID=53326 RepID=A0A016T617_9BILA|nr:hypothetical protein Y032_0131g1623 [Ancylostoma ceylanicum]
MLCSRAKFSNMDDDLRDRPGVVSRFFHCIEVYFSRLQRHRSESGKQQKLLLGDMHDVAIGVYKASMSSHRKLKAAPVEILDSELRCGW